MLVLRVMQVRWCPDYKLNQDEHHDPIGPLGIMKTTSPNQSEVEILQSLWERDVATVREVHSDILKRKQVGYTTTLKQFQRMEEKGLVERVSKVGRAHQYRATEKPKKSRQHLVSRLVETAFQGSTNQLVLHALGTSKLSSEQIQEIRDLLDELDKE
ncbi:MAG: BlaI/MecI/CopY family transcriptional regulator [Pseudomonadota bacterium]